MDEVSFGEWLKRRRKALGLTQEQFAQQLNCSTITLRKIEAEERRPSSQMVDLLAQMLNVLPSERAPFQKFARGDWKSASFGEIEDAPWRVPIPVPRTNLPIPLTSFIGREKEVEEIIRLLNKSRLVTLTGPGGVGKTRLAIQISNRLLSRFKDGVWWVELAPLMDEALVPQTVAQVLGVRESPNQPLSELLKSFLREKQLLLVLDNCEHLIAGCAHLADTLLGACPNLKILTTSREALGLTGEEVRSVPILSLPNPQRMSLSNLLMQYEGIHLFVERASAARSDFTLTEQNALSVTQVCQRLDGMPLAIELAAARVKMMSVAEISKHLDDRFDLLTAGSRTALPRHQTLRATIDWSYDLLTEPERVLLRRLAVFAGGFTLEAAEAVCSQGIKRSDILDLLGRLVDKSLVIVDEISKVGETRYRLLETIRQYALEKLTGIGEAQAVRDQHLGFYLGLAEKSEPHIFGRESVIWFSRLDKELDNIRAVMDWATNSGKADVTLRIAGSLVYFWFAHSPLLSEWHDRVGRALSRPKGVERTTARAKALNGIGFLYWADMDPTDRRPELEEALSIGRELGDQWNIATALRNLGLLDIIQGNYEEARPPLEQSLEIFRMMGPDGKMEVMWSLTFLGDLALNQDEVELAQSFYEETVVILRGFADFNFLPYSVRRLGLLALREGDYKKAILLCEESLLLNKEINDRRGVIACLTGFAAIAVAQEKFERATKLMAAAETQLTEVGIRLLDIDKKEYERSIALLRTQLDEKALAMLWEKGKGMSFDDAIAFALEEK